MTAITMEKSAAVEIELLRQLNEVIQKSEFGRHYRIVVAPVEVRVAEGEVFIQKVDSWRGIVEMHPAQFPPSTSMTLFTPPR
nr:hypothetical protein OH820_15275 [Streptomyces sp. NBC_00857]